MKLAIWALALSVFLSFCSGKKDRVEDSVLKGLYEGTGQKLVDSDTKFFIITANLDIYTLTKTEEKFYRVWKGSIGYDENKARVLYEYDEDEGLFESGDIIGKKMDSKSEAIPEQLRTLVEVNEAAFPLRQAIESGGFKLEVRLNLDEPAFKAEQAALLNRLAQNPDVLIEFLKKKNLEDVWVTDSTLTGPYISEGHLYLPAGITRSAEDVFGDLRDRPDSITSY